MEEKLTITNGQALSPAFQQAFSKLASQPVSLTVAYWLKRVLQVLQMEIPRVVSVRDEVLKPLEGKPLTDEARQLLAHLFDEKIELPLTRKLVLPVDSPNINLSAADLVALEPLVTIEEPVCSPESNSPPCA